jgi:hypothetical protein
MVVLRRKQSLTGGWLYQVWPDDHPAYLPELPWRLADEFCRAIREAMAVAFLIDLYENETQFTQEEWHGFFEAERELASSDPQNYADWARTESLGKRLAIPYKSFE